MKYKNNPFNIRRGSSHWLGSISQPGDQFESFDTLEHGIRAFYIIMRTYSTKYGRNTIRSIITRFAPPSENNVERYINFVSTLFGLSPDEQLVSFRDYSLLAKYMAIFEFNFVISSHTLAHVWKYYHIESKSFPLQKGMLERTVYDSKPSDDLPF